MEKPTVFDKEGEAMLNDSEQSETGVRPSTLKDADRLIGQPSALARLSTYFEFVTPWMSSSQVA